MARCCTHIFGEVWTLWPKDSVCSFWSFCHKKNRLTFRFPVDLYSWQGLRQAVGQCRVMVVLKERILCTPHTYFTYPHTENVYRTNWVWNYFHLKKKLTSHISCQFKINFYNFPKVAHIRRRLGPAAFILHGLYCTVLQSLYSRNLRILYTLLPWLYKSVTAHPHPHWEETQARHVQ